MKISDSLIKHPPHYVQGRSIEPIDVIEDWKLDYHLGNALKYISRAGRKDDYKQDIKKAIWYLERVIENLEEDEEDLKLAEKALKKLKKSSEKQYHGRILKKELKTEKEYEKTLQEVSRLMSAKPNTKKGKKLDKLVTMIEDYEDKHYSISDIPSLSVSFTNKKGKTWEIKE